MQKGFTGIRATAKVLSKEQGLCSVNIYNNSGVNLYFADDDISATADNGVPILPATSFSGLMEGDMWIGADVDNTEFRYMISKPLSFDSTTQNSGQNVRRTQQGFLAPKGGVCSFVLAFLFMLLSVVGVKAQTNVPIIGNKFTVYNNGPVSTFNGVLANSGNFRITPVPQNSYLILVLDNNNVGNGSHTFSSLQFQCIVPRGIPLSPNAVINGGVIPSYSYLFASNTGVATSSTLVTAQGSPVVGVGSKAIITVNVSACTDIYAQFLGTVTGTGTDPISIYGTFSQTPFTTSFVNATPAALTATAVGGQTATGVTPTGVNPVLVAGVDSGGGGVRTMLVNTLGGAVTTQFVTANDQVSNNANAQINCSTNSSTTCALAINSYLYNSFGWDRIVKCPTVVPVTIAAGTTSVIVAASGGAKVRVCSLFISFTTSGTLTMIEGTGATCGTGSTNVSGAMTMTASNTPFFSSGTSILQTNVVGDGLCMVSGTAVGAGFAQVEQH